MSWEGATAPSPRNWSGPRLRPRLTRRDHAGDTAASTLRLKLKKELRNLCRSGRFTGGAFLWARRFLGEFETDFAVLQFQMRRKWASFFRDELRQEIGLAGGDKFLHLLFGNFAVQNHLAYSKTACLRRADRVFAGVGPLENINLPFLAHRTQAERFVPRSVDLLLGIDSLLAKIKFLFEIAVQLHGGVEFATNLAAKSFQRTDATLGQKFFHLGSLEQTARHRFPNDQAARSTFERAVILIEWTTAAFRTFHLQR